MCWARPRGDGQSSTVLKGSSKFRALAQHLSQDSDRVNTYIPAAPTESSLFRRSSLPNRTPTPDVSMSSWMISCLDQPYPIPHSVPWPELVFLPGMPFPASSLCADLTLYCRVSSDTAVST